MLRGGRGGTGGRARGVALKDAVVDRLADAVTRRPWVVLLVAAVLAIAAWPSVRGLPLRTGRLELAPADDPAVVAYREFNRQFGALHTVFVILSGGAAEDVRACAARAAEALAKRPEHVRSVIHRLDVAQLEAQAIACAGTRALGELEALIARSAPLLNAIAREPTVDKALRVFVDEATDEETPVPSVAEALGLVRVLEGGLGAAERALAGDAAAARWDPAAAERARHGVDEDGWLVSLDRRSVLLVVSPAHAVDDPESAGRLLAAIREEMARVGAAYPRVEVAYAGAPVQDVEEQATIARDMLRTGLIAYAFVLLLSFVAFRNVFVAIRSNLVLGLAVYFALALAKLLVGQLNIISSVFVAVLVGLGDDFGIYLFTIYRELVPQHGKDAMRLALRSALKGLSTGAFTVAAAFLALQLQQFRAFRELGLIAGAGILAAFACMVAVLPAVIVLMHDRFPIGITGRRVRRGGPLSRAVLGWPRALLLVAGAALVLAALGIPRVGFDYRLTDLQAASSGAVRAEAMLADRFGLSSDFVVVRSDSLDQAARAAERLRASASVGAVSAVTDLVPGRAPDAAAVAAVAARASALAPVVKPAAGWPRIDPASLAGSLDRLPAALRRLTDLAKMQESRSLGAALERVEARRVSAMRALSAVAPEEAVRRLGTLTDRIAAIAARYRELLVSLPSVRPYEAATLPPALRDRYVGRDGSLATYAWPREALDDAERMRAFVVETSAAPGRASGLPVMVFRMLELIREGLLRTALPALLVILVTVWLDFRRVGHAALALLPMAAGTLATVGLMGWCGASWNAVSSIALPVMLGVGVDYGVNLVHRWQDEPDLREVLAGAGRAILYAGATSVMGFGSLVFADHRGLQSFGRTMALGTALQMVFALAVVPALLAMRRPRA